MKSFKEVIEIIILGLSVALWATVSNGCAAAAVGAGAGAVGAVVYTDRGAEGNVNGTPADVNRRALAVFSQMGIKVKDTSTKDSGKEKKLVGQAGKRQVTVDIKSSGTDVSKVDVVANKGFMNVEWDKDYAKDVMTKIVQQG